MTKLSVNVISNEYVLELVRALHTCVSAMRNAEKHGCLDHIGCAEDSRKFWYDALEKAESILGEKI